MTSTHFYFNAIKDWNSLPIPLKSTKNFRSFKSGVKEFIFNRPQNYNVYPLLSDDVNSQALVSFKKYMPPPLPYFKVNTCPLPLPHFASIFFAYL
jgi:hypothetical protein